VDKFFFSEAAQSTPIALVRPLQDGLERQKGLLTARIDDTRFRNS
jgi:hypothetical protein